MLWWPPRHAQGRKYLPFILAFYQRPLRQIRSQRAAHHILVKSPLVQTHALCTGEQTQAPVEDIIASEVDQTGSYLNLLLSHHLVPEGSRCAAICWIQECTMHHAICCRRLCLWLQGRIG